MDEDEPPVDSLLRIAPHRRGIGAGNCCVGAGTGLRLRDARVGSESRAEITREADTEGVAI